MDTRAARRVVARWAAELLEENPIDDDMSDADRSRIADATSALLRELRIRAGLEERKARSVPPVDPGQMNLFEGGP